MQKNYTQLILGIIIGLIICLFIGKQIFKINQSPNTSSIQSSSPPDAVAQNQDKSTGISSGNENNDSIPQKVYVVLKYILAHHHAMDGYVGGRVFTNREK